MQELTIELEELGVQRRRDWLIIWIVLEKKRKMRIRVVSTERQIRTYASRYGCASASSTVIRFFGSNVYCTQTHTP